MMLGLRLSTQVHGIRFLSTTATPSPSLAQLVAQLRKETQAPIGKARAALTDNGNDYNKALAALREAAAKTSAKVAHRTTKEGLVGVFAHVSRCGMVEINCETDFVQRGDIFTSTVKTITNTLASGSTPPCTPAPLSLFGQVTQPETLKVWADDPAAGNITPLLIESIAKCGENVQLRRITLSPARITPSIVYGAYAHGGPDASMGRIAALVALSVSNPVVAREKVVKLARQVAQQVVGFAPEVVHEKDVLRTGEAAIPSEELDSKVLYRQPFLVGGGSVKEVLEAFEKQHGIDLNVVEFRRYVCGEGIEVKESNFAEEVLAQAGLKA
ncbi:elongation factor TS-domain-containing protein [Chytriomyces sp. MP71]|nr:elongation factor TS-domain-containing protein [Chytriomyces sp. MP71]